MHIDWAKTIALVKKLLARSIGASAAVLPPAGQLAFYLY